MRVLTAAEMREADRRTIEDLGIPSLVLMENAGHAVVEALHNAFDDLDDRRIVVLCGRGSNGGDGFVVARSLAERGLDVVVYLVGAAADVTGDARRNLDLLGQLGHPVVEVPDSATWELHGPAVTRCDLLVDAVLGTGLSRPLEGMLETIAADINTSDVPVVAIDMPSGLSADSHHPIGATIRADLTVTLGAPKLPLVLDPGADEAGDLVIADIGIPAGIIEDLPGPWTGLITDRQVCYAVPPRALDSHKGDFGRVLVVGGSPGKTGAAVLAGLGALRAGAGLVTVATPRGCLGTVAGSVPEYMTVPLDEEPDGQVSGAALATILEQPCDVIAVGPGLGTGPGAARLVRGLLDEASVPLVLDADALNVLAGDTEPLREHEGRDVIITPHPGEMGRLIHSTPEEVQAHRVETARDFATSHGVYVILKGAQTVVAGPGARVLINQTGNPGMASGGMGDVLTGVTAAWVAQLLDAEAACLVSVYLHGLAGDLGVETTGETALLATDLAAQLGRALIRIEEAGAASDS